MFRPLYLALALLLPGGVNADQPPAASETLAQASSWLVGRWITSDDERLPGAGRGTMNGVMEVRADGTLLITGEFWPEGASHPRADLGGGMTATWRMEDAEPNRLRLRLDDIWVTEGDAAPRPGGTHLQVMDLGIQPDGSLYDIEGQFHWQRQGP
jgi:hypothetical protein